MPELKQSRAAARVIAGLLVVIAAVVEPPSAEACTCQGPESPGEAFTRAPVVFVGTVGAAKQIAGDRYETTFAVTEVFRGKVGKTAVIASEWDSVSCDYGRFPPGERMLIYAGGRGPLRTSGCSGTKPLSEAAADLAYLRRSIAAGIATVEGTITTLESSAKMGVKPRPNALVRARGTKHAARTGADGKFRLEVPPGTYTLEVIDPDPGFSARVGRAEPVVLSAVGSWARRDFSVAWDGRIRGRLLDHAGRPAAGVLVRALDVDAADPTRPEGYVDGSQAKTDAAGNYEITHVPAGRYRVAVSVPFDPAFPVPATYYPGVPAIRGARIVEVSQRSSLATGIEFTLRPPQRVFTISGVVAWARAGGGSSGARVTLLNKTDRRWSETYVYSNDSKFAFKEVEGATVKIYVCDDTTGKGDCSDPVTFKIEGDRSINLTLPR